MNKPVFLQYCRIERRSCSLSVSGLRKRFNIMYLLQSSCLCDCLNLVHDWIPWKDLQPLALLTRNARPLCQKLLSPLQLVVPCRYRSFAQGLCVNVRALICLEKTISNQSSNPVSLQAAIVGPRWFLFSKSQLSINGR